MLKAIYLLFTNNRQNMGTLIKGKRSTITRIKEEQGTDGALLRTFTCHG